MIVPTIFSDPQVQGLLRRLERRGGVVSVSGPWGSSAPMLAAFTHAAAGRRILYVTAHVDEADAVLDDLELFGVEEGVLFPAWESLPGEGAGAGEIAAERLRVCADLAGAPGSRPDVMVCPVAALMQPVPTPDTLPDHTLRLGTGEEHAPEAVTQWLVDRGFERLELVESIGDYAHRGDIVDVYAPGEMLPYRLEFTDDRIDSIRRFDPSSQRSVDRVDAIAVPTLGTGFLDGAPQAGLLDYIPPDTLVVLEGPGEIQEIGRAYHRSVGDRTPLYEVRTVLAATERFDRMHLGRFGPVATSSDDTFVFDVGSVTRFEIGAGDAVAELCRLSVERTVVVVCDNAGERQRLIEMVTEQIGRCPATLSTPIGRLHCGFEWTAAATVVVGHHEVFRRQRPRHRLRRVSAASVEAWTDLATGDLVVHVVHGIARFKGLQTLRKGDSAKKEEFLTLEFADRALMHVPTSQIDLVQKYVGAAGHRPTLSKLGGTRWGKTTAKVEEAVCDLAEAMLRIQAERETHAGVAYPADTEWQKEFEASFPYEETEDQLSAAADVAADLTRAVPMDRLLCGDVGYGKTELAMRAVFKVVEYGRQAAVLVPTTVLAEQHYQTFTERFAEYPFIIACLSRFRSTSEQARIVQRARKGQIDVLIGTHRLLSKDVAFANLGLVIVDEEQRFGVEHKERLKGLRSTVDVLTMTATPIPRTLHMSMLGLRDICSLATPPMDRRSIATQVRSFDEGFVRDAILREMNRDGQVFFVHNYVQSIQAMADKVRGIVPEARILVGHGQMKDGELDRVMTDFVRRRADVLVCTTIIESGIDIPSANTIFINRADRFGLADLHQLRGRVGRSKHRAYCYLLLPTGGTVTPKAARRLKAIEEFSDLGAGFRIAMRDLEIRGAGNILGAEQSGHIAAVGYELYCRLLDKTVRGMKNEPDPTPRPVHLELNVVAHIPHTYIASARSRIEIYRRLVACCTTADITRLEHDLVDAFGPFPPAVGALLELAEIRVLARPWAIDSIIVREPDIVFTVSDLACAQVAFIEAPGSVRMPDARTIHLRPPRPSYLEPQTLVPLLRKLLAQPVKEEALKP